ncbi:RsiV family protein [Phytopseudomonas daroniae]|uniref:RsiV family protein n=1 Tax=Phytopseudomonas daroniae TaxID=2487519 RepID=UPI00103836C6|nr:RsiV family protein [Pseudomonas daroniae]TBU79065.1 DUF3298 domain-containing protein [Pseudomonas daroniae]
MNTSTIARLGAILSLGLLLGACQSLSKPDTPPALATIHERWEHKAPGCTAQDCPLVNIELQRLADQPELNARIESTLLGLVSAATDTRPQSLADHEREFLANGKPGWVSYLQAKVLSQHDRLVVIELSSYHFIGGAHGVPGRTYLNYDRELNKVLSLQDILVPGEETAFWQIAQRAHQAWLIAQGHGDDADYRQTWPFERTPNIALNPDAVLLKYDVARLAPYSDGHPEIKIPYSQLQGILRPVYVPGGAAR